MYKQRQHKRSQAFALPTVLIASIVLLTILAVSVTATVAVRTALKSQFYVQLAQVAGESGVAYAKACLAANGNVPLWSDSKPLTPATDCSGNVIVTPSVNALIIAGGGSGGGSTGGGGGAGGLVYNPAVAITATSYPVVVGSGAASTTQQKTGSNGGNSSFNGLSAIGGGGGGYSNGTAGGPGLSGGSGGGGENYLNLYAPGAGTFGQGSVGGIGAGRGSGGGGGAGGPGNPGLATFLGGAGGLGVQNNISGSSVYYAAGGGGGSSGIGGSGIGGSGGTNGTAGATNTGSGGGGGWDYNGGSGGAGGSGVVVISYPTNSGIVATGGTPSTSGTNQIQTFTSSGVFNVTSVGNVTCPSAPSCSVLVNGNVRSSFSVPKPSLDVSTGQAVTISNNGYVEVTRTTTGGVWRTYKQPSVQAAVVPDLCSGNATSARGWAAAVKTTQQDSLPSATSAQTISSADAAINAGVLYFRRDFNISKKASYDLNVYTSSGQDIATAYIDGQLLTTAAGSLGSVSTTLTTGCHTMVVQLTNATAIARASHFTGSLTLSSAAAPIVVTDARWRVSAGDPANFSNNNYFEASNSWEPAAVLGVWSNTALVWGGNPTNWSSVSGDSLTQWISSQSYSKGSVAPSTSYTLFRDTVPFVLTSANTVRVTDYCDDGCDLYLDGVLIFSNPTTQSIVSKSITIQPGTHTFGVRLYNGGSVPNASGFLFTAVSLSTSKVLSRSNVDWDVNNFWSTASFNSNSNDSTYLPTPAVYSSANVRVLVVGGGGSGGGSTGGGGGAGGVVDNSAFSLSPISYQVTVGAGGATTAQQTQGNTGAKSSFGGITALGGGGGGASAPNVNGTGGLGGGSGGGGQNYYAVLVAGPGVPTQGFDGGGGIAANAGGGGGAGGVGGTIASTNIGGPGGIGFPSNITGSVLYYGGGGGGGNGGAGGNGGGGAGAVTGTAGSAGTGGGGGGGWNHYGGSGGAGGSGIVVIAVPTGTMAISAPGAVITTSGSNTIYSFNSNSTFTVTSVNAAPARSTNIAPPFSQWTLSGSATYDSSSGQLNLPPTGFVTSPLILVSMPTSMTVGGDFYAASPSANATIAPQAAFHYGVQYYQADGTTPATSTAGYTGNGCALGFAQSVWDNNDLRSCGWQGGPNTVYASLYIYGSNNGYSSPNLILRNPQFVTY